MGSSLIGRTLAQYEVLSCIGQGGMGEVYAARDTRLGRTVALKTLPPEMARVPERRARFEREAKAVAALNHPNIVTLYSVEESDGLHFITMELVEGKSLRHLVPDDGLSPERVFELGIPIVDAVAAAHRKGISHRDLKPDNVMVTADGRIKVLDFGLAKLHDTDEPGDPSLGEETSARTGDFGDAVTEEGRVLGTVAYMSPEQAEGKASDHRSDIFSLGVLLYAMSTGRRPFTGDSHASITAAILRDTPRPVHEVNGALPREFGRVVRRCMEKDPDRRFQGAADLRLELEEVRREFVSGELSVSQSSLRSSVPSAHPEHVSDVHGESPTRLDSDSGSRSDLAGGGSVDSFAGRFQRTGLPRLLAVFALVSVVVLFLVRWVMLEWGLPDWVLPGAFVLLIVGLPVLVTTAWIQAAPREGELPSGDSAMRSVSEPAGLASSPGGLRRWLTWNKAIGGGVLAFVGLAVVIGGYVVTRSRGIGPAASLVSSGLLEDKSRILIADFLNQTDDPLLGQTMKEAFTVDLSQSSVVRLVAPSEVGAVLRRMELEPKTALDEERAREVALRDGIPAVITGRINPAGSGTLLSVRLIAAESGGVLAAFRENAGGPDEMIAAIDRLSSRLREKMGESLKTIRANPPLGQVTTSSLPALRRYTEAVAIVEGDEEGSTDRAIALLEEATEIDTTFAMAFRKLAVVLANSFRERSRVMEATDRAFRHRNRLTERERYLTEANYYDRHGDREKAKHSYRQLIELDPEDSWALNNLGLLYQRDGDPFTAEEYFRRCEPGASRYGNIFGAQIDQGNPDSAEQTLAEFMEKYPEQGVQWFQPMVLGIEREDYAGAQEVVLNALQGNREDLSELRSELSAALSLAYLRGQVQEARRLTEERLGLMRRSFSSRDYLNTAIGSATIEAWVFGEVDFADQLVASALREFSVEDLPAADRPYIRLATFYLIRGRSAEAESMLDSYTKILPELELREPGGRFLLCQGLRAMRDGETEAALVEFRRWAGRSEGNAGPHAWIGNAYYADAQLDSAIVHYETYLTKRGVFNLWEYRNNLAKVLTALADSYERTGQPLRAAEYYGKLADLWSEADPQYRRRADSARENAERLLGEGS